MAPRHFMNLTHSASPRPSDLFNRRETVIRAVRHSLLDFARQLHLLATEAPQDFPGLDPIVTGEAFDEHVTVEELLGTIHNTWEPDTHPRQEDADPWGIEAQHVRSTLLDFAAFFGLLDCSCVRAPNCRHGRAKSLAPADLIELLDEEWHGRSGCMQHLPTDSDTFIVQRQIEENLHLVERLTPRLRVWPEALERYEQIRPTRWYREARHLADHTLDTWMSDITDEPRVRAALLAATETAASAGWEEPIRTLYYTLLSDAISAVLVFRIASEDLVQTLYEAIEPHLPFAELRLPLAG